MTDDIDCILSGGYPTEPRRIYNWQHSQLSIARFYGGCTINGVMYVIRTDLEGQPLEEMVIKPRKKRKAKGTK